VVAAMAAIAPIIQAPPVTRQALALILQDDLNQLETDVNLPSLSVIFG
jgi:hypothetical protein